MTLTGHRNFSAQRADQEEMILIQVSGFRHFVELFCMLFWFDFQTEKNEQEVSLIVCTKHRKENWSCVDNCEVV